MKKNIGSVGDFFADTISDTDTQKFTDNCRYRYPYIGPPLLERTTLISDKVKGTRRLVMKKYICCINDGFNIMVWGAVIITCYHVDHLYVYNGVIIKLYLTFASETRFGKQTCGVNSVPTTQAPWPIYK